MVMAEHRHLPGVVCMWAGKVRLASSFLPACRCVSMQVRMCTCELPALWTLLLCRPLQLPGAEYF